MYKKLVTFLCLSLIPLLAYGFPLGSTSGSPTTDASELISGILPAARVGDNSILPPKIGATGTPDNTMYLRWGSATGFVWSTPSGTATTTLPWDNISATDNALVPGKLKASNAPDNTMYPRYKSPTELEWAVPLGNLSTKASFNSFYIDQSGTPVLAMSLNRGNYANLFIGGAANETGSTTTSNIAIGPGSFAAAVEANNNTILGIDAAMSLTNDVGNVIVGEDAFSGGSGDNNTTIGYYAGGYFSSGNYNTFIGKDSGVRGVGSYNTWVGASSGSFDLTGATEHSNSSALGYGAVVTDNNQVSLGNTSVSSFLFGGGPLPVSGGGTGSDNAAGARTNLGLAIGTDVLAPDGDASQVTGLTSVQVSGLGTMATQSATDVNIDGGAIDNTPIGATTPATGRFTTLTFDEAVSNCVPADNNCGQIATNVGTPSAVNLSAGLQWFDNTAAMLMIRNPDNNANLQVFTSGANHTGNFSTTGTLTGKVNVSAKTDNAALTGSQLYGSIIECGAGCDNVVLPAKVQGYQMCVLATDNTQKRVTPDGSDYFVYEGLAADAAEALVSPAAGATSPIGEYLCFYGSTVDNKWFVTGRGKTAWTEAAP